tara:strand:+ start:250 stop:825 length:576 start_codon:yes stop_codon:yes gene_type:complete
MRTNLLIVDNFYRDPNTIRDIALSSNFQVKGNYPGRRTRSYASDDVKQVIQTLLLPHAGKITWWSTEGYNGAFQYTTAKDRSWIHADNGTTWAGLVYLTPDAPLSSGTGLYKHKETGATEWDPNCGIEYNDYKPNRETQDYTKWELVDRIGNKYNRLVLYRGNQYHVSLDYFGNNKEDGRLFQTFFFNTEY